MDRKPKNLFSYSSNRPPGGPLSLSHSPPAPPSVAISNHDSHLYMISPAPDRTDHRHSQGSVNSPPLVTLTSGRRGPKAKNEYVDTPQSKETAPHAVTQTNKSKLLQSQTTQQVFLEQAVCSQPKSINHKQHQLPSDHVKKCANEDRDSTANHERSYICKNCNKCQCQACTSPRELPKKWVGRDKYECSVQKVGDYCTCMCCVQLLFQTCCNDPEDQQDVADNPCACCEQRHCCKRWMCMLCLLPCLPGLLLYPCFKGCLALCTKCYNHCTNPGCKCKKEKFSGNQRPLLDSESSST